VKEFLQLTVAGISLGSRYAVVALGFVMAYAATRVINFAHAGFVLLGAYLAYNARQTWGLPFPVALLVAIVGVAVVAAVVEAAVVGRLHGEAPWIASVATIGVLIVLNQVVPRIWGFVQLDMGDPWGIDRFEIGGVVILDKDAWAIGLGAAAVIGLFVFLRATRYGLALRAAAIDGEAAAAQGIPLARVHVLAWGLAGASAGLAGTMIGTGAGAVQTGIGTIAFAALPAMILGGLDSPVGAVIGGLVIGLSQVWTAGYQPQWAPWLGQGFDAVTPYIVMVAILLVRPRGLFGSRRVRTV
jgi:branched-chain amino acid transport system permease protein